MPRIHLLHWPDDLSPAERTAYGRVWKQECRADLWANDYSRALAIKDGTDVVAVLVYIRVKHHRINFGRMTLKTHRGKGYAGALLRRLISRFPRDTLECQNVNPALTAGLERAGFRPLGNVTRTYRLAPRKH